MTHASVFSGIGGPEVAATMLGYGQGWNDRKELIDKMKELCQEKN